MEKQKGRRVNGVISLSEEAVLSIGGVPVKYDTRMFSYISSGNGEGNVGTIEYKVGGKTGTTVATKTLTYNSDNDVESIELSIV